MKEYNGGRPRCTDVAIGVVGICMIRPAMREKIAEEAAQARLAGHAA